MRHPVQVQTLNSSLIAALGASAEQFSSLAQPLLLGFLFSVCFPPRNVPRFDFEGQFPQGLLSQVVAEIVEERHYVVVSFDVVMSGKAQSRAAVKQGASGDLSQL